MAHDKIVLHQYKEPLFLTRINFDTRIDKQLRPLFSWDENTYPLLIQWNSPHPLVSKWLYISHSMLVKEELTRKFSGSFIRHSMNPKFSMPKPTRQNMS